MGICMLNFIIEYSFTPLTHKTAAAKVKSTLCGQCWWTLSIPYLFDLQATSGIMTHPLLQPHFSFLSLSCWLPLSRNNLSSAAQQILEHLKVQTSSCFSSFSTLSLLFQRLYTYIPTNASPGFQSRRTRLKSTHLETYVNHHTSSTLQQMSYNWFLLLLLPTIILLAKETDL